MSTEFRDWGRRLSNWGRWGNDGARGTLNWITPSDVAAAAALVRTGEVVSLGLPLGEDGPQPPDGVRPNPRHVVTRGPDAPPETGGFQWMDDLVELPTQAATQIDALSHVAYDGYLFDGVPVTSVTADGATHLGVETLRDGIVGRGLLLDVARLHGLERLPGGHVVTIAEVEATLAMANLETRPGDTLLLRTGWVRTLGLEGRSAFMAGEPGVDLPMTQWLHDHRTAFLASDTWGVEVVPSSTGDSMPVHCVLVRDMGMPLGEMFDLERLSERCAALQRWEFLFVASPLQIMGGLGSPLEPKAIL